MWRLSIRKMRLIRPLTVITGILLGPCLSIVLSLSAVLIIFSVVGDDYPRLEHEFGAIFASSCLFTAMTAISAVSFYSLALHHDRRCLAQTIM